ncbi:cholesterol 24-hydroxylase [Trichosurus vulpecula]|uniref:cholesterol 24-hydroxylase n=1 Tax=Trichosurus vulpecula TaxID=9337 RepID=UPI00186B48E5|nr:cholesterol 24-hydroxylase [Trichosurus vulpecula]
MTHLSKGTEMELLAGDLWESCLFLLLSGPLLAFGFYCAYVHYVHLRYDHIPGPPRASFLFGHLSYLTRQAKDSGKIRQDVFLEWAKEYGPIVRINVLHRASVIITSPELVKVFLMSPQYKKDALIYSKLHSLFGKRFLGRGLVSELDHELWQKQRRIFDLAFHRSYLMSSMGTINEKAEQMMEMLEAKADGKTEVCMEDVISSTVYAISTKTFFGMELKSLVDEQKPFLLAIRNVIEGVTLADNPFLKFSLRKRKWINKTQESIRFLREMGKEWIEYRREAIQNNREFPPDVIMQMLKAEAEEGINDEFMVDNFVTFLIAGAETSSNQILLALMELQRHPEIVERLHAEVDEVIGSKKIIEYQDLGKLQYLSQVLKEILRIYPPVTGTVRRLEKDTVFDGVLIPGCTSLFFSTYVMGRMEMYFEDPLTFNPDRFSPGAFKPNFTYFPFSLGPRSCIGQYFSQMEVKVLMAKLFQRLKFQMVPGQSFGILDSVTLKPKDGLVCTVKLRGA